MYLLFIRCTLNSKENVNKEYNKDNKKEKMKKIMNELNEEEKA